MPGKRHARRDGRAHVRHSSGAQTFPDSSYGRTYWQWGEASLLGMYSAVFPWRGDGLWRLTVQMRQSSRGARGNIGAAGCSKLLVRPESAGWRVAWLLEGCQWLRSLRVVLLLADQTHVLFGNPLCENGILGTDRYINLRLKTR